jgi:hypothetical protein
MDILWNIVSKNPPSLIVILKKAFPERKGKAGGSGEP